MGSVMVDGPTLFFQGAILLMAIVALALDRRAPRECVRRARRPACRSPQGSAVPGSLAEQQATSGVTPDGGLSAGDVRGRRHAALLASADLLTIFVALEVLSLPLYLLCGLARKRRLLSQEAALKYFLLGAFSSAFFLYGVVLVYGYAGTLTLSGIADAVEHAARANITGGDRRRAPVVGLLFKVGAVPFHSWVPDVYQGAPTPITGFMAAATKLAAFGAMLRIFYVALPGLIATGDPSCGERGR